MYMYDCQCFEVVRIFTLKSLCILTSLASTRHMDYTRPLSPHKQVTMVTEKDTTAAAMATNGCTRAAAVTTSKPPGVLIFEF